MLNKFISKLKRYMAIKELEKNNVIIERQVDFMTSIFKGHNYVAQGTVIRNTVVGVGSYFGKRCVLEHVEIGNFCSFADDVRVLPNNHPTTFVSTHPAFHRGNHPLMVRLGLNYTENLYPEVKFIPNTVKAVSIGNDVWIGDGVKILPGITIGDGAVIAAGSVVTKDVKSFFIVGGGSRQRNKKTIFR
jgi:acetyltransferase-like isoleucine patch superfamily enzyme